MEEMEPQKVNLMCLNEKFMAIPVGFVLKSGVPSVHTCWTWAFTIIRSYQLTCEFKRCRKNLAKASGMRLPSGSARSKKADESLMVAPTVRTNQFERLIGAFRLKRTLPFPPGAGCLSPVHWAVEEMEPQKVNLMCLNEKFMAIPVGFVLKSGVPSVHTCWTWAFTIIRSYQLTCEFKRYRKNLAKASGMRLPSGSARSKKADESYIYIYTTIHI